MNVRREFGAAVALCACAGALGLAAGSRPWLALTVARGDPLPPVGAVVTGSDLAPLVPGLAIVVLAGVVGLLATRRWGRVVVGALLAVAGAGLLWAALPALGGTSGDALRAAAFDAGLPAGEVTGASTTTGPALAVVAGVLAVLAGALVVLRGRQWPGLGSRYETPSARAAPKPVEEAGATGAVAGEVPPADRMLWDALDRGEDPTR